MILKDCLIAQNYRICQVKQLHKQILKKIIKFWESNLHKKVRFPGSFEMAKAKIDMKTKKRKI